MFTMTTWWPEPIDDPLTGDPNSVEVRALVSAIQKTPDPWADHYLTAEDRRAWRNG
jgi:hypothetical protein